MNINAALGMVERPIDRDEVAELRRQLAEVTRERDELLRDVKHAVSETKRREPDYPFGEETASECVWCLGEGLLGVTRACDEWTERCQSAERERDDLRDQSVMTIHGLTAERNALSTKLAKAEADAAAMRRTMTENESRLKDVIRRIGVSTTTGWITHELNHVLLDIPSGTAGRELLDEMQRKDVEIKSLKGRQEHLVAAGAMYKKKASTAKLAYVETLRGKIDPAWFGEQMPVWQYRGHVHGAVWRTCDGRMIEYGGKGLGIWDKSTVYRDWNDLLDNTATYPCDEHGKRLADGGAK